MEWHNRLKPEQNKVNYLIKEMHRWRENGYLDTGVWKRLETIVNPELLREATSAVPSAIPNADGK